MVAVQVEPPISIHPPARGGTVIGGMTRRRMTYFNPPTRKGWDIGDSATVVEYLEFQSTHPQGVGLYFVL